MRRKQASYRGYAAAACARARGKVRTADGLEARVGEEGAVNGCDLAVVLVRPAGVVGDALDGEVDVDGVGHGVRLAVVERLERGQRVAVALHQRRQLEEQRAARARVHAAPRRAAHKGRVRRGHGRLRAGRRGRGGARRRRSRSGETEGRAAQHGGSSPPQLRFRLADSSQARAQRASAEMAAWRARAGAAARARRTHVNVLGEALAHARELVARRRIYRDKALARDGGNKLACRRGQSRGRRRGEAGRR